MGTDDERAADEIGARFADGDQTALVKFGLDEGGVVVKGIVGHKDDVKCLLYIENIIRKN